MHEGFLVYANSKYLKWAVALSLTSIAAAIEVKLRATAHFRYFEFA